MTKEQLTDIVCEMLGCGYMDLSIFDDCDYDFGELIEEAKFNFGELTFGGLFSAMMDKGLGEMQDAINETLEEDEELAEKIGKIDVFEDIEYYCNYLDSGVYFNDSEREELYREHFADAIKTFEENTGFTL